MMEVDELWRGENNGEGRIMEGVEWWREENDGGGRTMDGEKNRGGE